MGAYKCAQTDGDLSSLVEKIFRLSGDFRIRFSSIEAREISPRLLKELKKGKEKFCSYFHIPLQSGSNKVLKEMNRRQTVEAYAGKISEIRKLFPDAGIFADIIVGYPTENEDDFKRSVDFIKKIAFSGLHVFSYSSRPQTASFKLESLNPNIVKDRSRVMRELDAAIRAEFGQSLMNSIQRSIVLKHKGAFSHSLTSNFQNIRIEGRHEIGSFVNALITGRDKATVFENKGK